MASVAAPLAAQGPKEETPFEERGYYITFMRMPTYDLADWKRIVVKYQQPSAARASWQIINTLVPYALLWILMYHTLAVSWWITAALAILAGAFLVRIFIIFHDCGHGSFFKSRVANDVWGFLCGILTFTPYYHWRWEHSLHHATSGDLDRRGTGDVWTLTVQEYLESSRWKRFAYRLARNPIVLFALAPLLTRYGGHSQAAGVSLPLRNLAAFAEGLSSVTAGMIEAGGAPLPRIEIDGDVRLSDVNIGLLEEWERIRPFGMGNREPILRSEGLLVTRIRPFGPSSPNNDLLPAVNWPQRCCETGCVAELESARNLLRKAGTSLKPVAAKRAVVGRGRAL